MIEENLICKKVNSMLSLYLDEALAPEQMEFMDRHLEECEECKTRFENLKSVMTSLRNSYQKVRETSQPFFNIKEYEYFHDNASAFIDNELDEEQRAYFMSCLQKSTLAQKKLDELLKTQMLLKKTFNEVAAECPIDYSKKIVHDLKNEKKIFNIPSVIYKKAAVVLGIVALFSAAIFPGGHKLRPKNKSVPPPKKVIYVRANPEKPENIAGFYF